MSFAKNIGKNVSNKYGQKLIDITKKSATDAIKRYHNEQFRRHYKQLET